MQECCVVVALPPGRGSEWTLEKLRIHVAHHYRLVFQCGRARRCTIKLLLGSVLVEHPGSSPDPFRGDRQEHA
jgi:hypothetical protein